MSTPDPTAPAPVVRVDEPRPSRRGFGWPEVVSIITSGAMIATMLYTVSKLPGEGSGEGSAPTTVTVTARATDQGSPAAPGASDAPQDQATTQVSPGAEGQPTAQPTQTLPEDVRKKLIALQRRTDGDPMAMGSVNAPVVLIEWADYRCPFCGVWARDTLPQLQKYVDDGTLRIEYRDLPLFGEQSTLAAIGGHAAAKQGKFWEYYRVVTGAAPTSGHPDWPQEKIVEFAKQAGVPEIAAFTKDLKDPKLAEAVQKDTQEITQFGVSGTPFFLINDVPLSGAQPAEVFIQQIEALAQKK